MPLDGSPISLGRAVSDAGGRTERAALTKVVLVRNNNEKIELNMYPLLVEGKVESEFTVNPEVVSFGSLSPGEKKTINVVVRGRKPFAIEKIES